MAKSYDLHRIGRPIKARTVEHEDGAFTLELAPKANSAKLSRATLKVRSVVSNYVEETVLRQAVIQSELLERPIADVLEKIAPMFICGDDEYERLKKHIANATFAAIRSAKQTAIYRRYVGSFCSDTAAYGKESSELRALTVKEKAYALLDLLTADGSSSMFDTVTALAKKQGSDADSCGEYQVTYALVMYLQGKPKEAVAQSLNSALKHGNIAAGLLLLYIDPDSDKRESIYARLQSIPDFKLREGLDNAVCRAYAIKPNVIKRNEFLGAMGGDNE